jgi:hypothetical protein
MIPDVVQIRILSSILDHNKQKYAAISVYARFFSTTETSSQRYRLDRSSIPLPLGKEGAENRSNLKSRQNHLRNERIALLSYELKAGQNHLGK